MKRNTLAMALAGVGLMGAMASADLITNGDFETGTGLTFETTPNWFNRGTGGQTANARGDNLNLGDSTRNAVINEQFTVDGGFGAIAHSQNTGHAIQEDDYFALSYDWRDASEWQDRDVVRFVHFATADNTLAGTVVWSDTLDSGGRTSAATWESVSQETAVVNSAAVGQTLFVNFYGVDPLETGPAGFARVDNITVEVIPEPGTFALLALAGGLIAFRRRIRWNR